MPDYPTLILLLALVGLAVLAFRPLPRAPMVVHLGAVALCLGLLLSLKLDGWTDMGDRVLGISLGLLAFWVVLVLPGRPWAEILARAGAWLFAGFFVAVGAASLRNDTPLSPGLALGVMSFGLALLLVPVLARPRPGRIWALAAAGLLAAGLAASRYPLDVVRLALAP